MNLAHISTHDLTRLLEEKVSNLKVQGQELRGGQRRVFVGTIGKKSYAFKVFKGYSDALVRAQRETATLRKCISPHLVKPGPFELIQLTDPEEGGGGEDEPGALWLYVEEFIDGESLRQRLLRGPLTVAETFRLALECLDAIESLWVKKRVHRDIKPANIMIRSSDKAFLIIDAGYVLVLDASRVTSPQFAVGTPGYMAPEQFMTLRPRVDFRADIFGLGVCMYEGLTGNQPFRKPGDSKDEVLKKTIRETPQPPVALRADTPLCLSDVVMGMLSKKPHLRPRSISILRDALTGCRDDKEERT